MIDFWGNAAVRRKKDRPKAILVWQMFCRISLFQLTLMEDFNEQKGSIHHIACNGDACRRGQGGICLQILADFL